MNTDDLFKIEPQEPHKMSQTEFVEKTKSILEKIYNAYLQGWQRRALIDGEHPEESVCDKCTGCGLFMYNGEEKECVQDRERGECFHRFCDYEQVGMDLETHLKDIFDLLSVDELVAVRKRGGDNGKRKCLIGESGEKICQCTKPRQSPFPDGKIICLRCWGEWYH